jgi:hypothetical protein
MWVEHVWKTRPSLCSNGYLSGNAILHDLPNSQLVLSGAVVNPFTKFGYTQIGYASNQRVCTGCAILFI